MNAISIEIFIWKLKIFLGNVKFYCVLANAHKTVPLDPLSSFRFIYEFPIKLPLMFIKIDIGIRNSLGIPEISAGN